MVDLLKVMEREALHSEHAAQCFIEAKRRDGAKKKADALKALLPPEREFCGTFHGTPHRATCEKYRGKF